VTINTNYYNVTLWAALLYIVWAALPYNALRGCPLFCVYTYSPTSYRVWSWLTGYKLTEICYTHTLHTLTASSELVKCEYWSDTQIQYCIQCHRKHRHKDKSAVHINSYVSALQWPVMGLQIVPLSWVWGSGYKLMVSKVNIVTGWTAAYVLYNSTVWWKQTLSRVKCYCALPPM
jgi:hypothetical protein